MHSVRFLHFADLHIGMENYGRLDPVTGLHSRLIDFSNTFNWIVDYALTHDIELVVFAGDAYKTREPSPTHENILGKGIKRLSDAGIPVVLVIGNHDLPNTVGKSDTLTIYDALTIPNVYVSSKPQLLRITTKNGTPVQVATLPWALRSHLLTKEDHFGKNVQEINDLMTERLVAIIDHHANEADANTPTIFVSHATVAGATFGSEQNVMLGSDIVVPLGALKNPKFHYSALGHLHRHQILSENPPVIYAGSPDRIDFGEEKEEKGFMVGTITVGMPTTYAFIPTPVRPFLTIAVTIDDTDTQPTESVLRAIRAHTLTDTIVRLTIDISQEQNRLLDDVQIREALAPAHYFAGSQKVIRVSTRLRARETEVSPTLAPLDALQRYIQAKQVDPARASELTKHATALMKELTESSTDRDTNSTA